MIKIFSYFDASGGAEHAEIVVAGYVSTANKWTGFDSDWRKALARKEFDVPYFHMKEFAHSTDVFAEWKGDERRRRRFLTALIAIIGKYAQAGFACMIKNSEWDGVNKEYPLDELYGCQYALAGRDCANKTFVWGRTKGKTDGEIRTIFEDGDKGKGHLSRVLQEAHKPSPIFEYGRPHCTTNDFLGVTPLQASDFAAWELSKVIRSGKEHSSLSECRVPLQKLSRIVPVSWTQYKRDDFIKLLSLGNIGKRAASV